MHRCNTCVQELTDLRSSKQLLSQGGPYASAHLMVTVTVHLHQASLPHLCQVTHTHHGQQRHPQTHIPVTLASSCKRCTASRKTYQEIMCLSRHLPAVHSCTQSQGTAGNKGYYAFYATQVFIYATVGRNVSHTSSSGS
mgnify:CR=1 FL=1